MENEYFYQPLNILGIGGIGTWAIVLCSFICLKVQRRRFTNNIDIQWIENHEKKTKLPISKLIANLEKASQVSKKIVKFIKGFTIYFSSSFLVHFLAKSSYNDMALSGLALTALCIPMWIHTVLLITFLDDKRKRIIEVMKETHSGQQSSLSEAREREK